MRFLERVPELRALEGWYTVDGLPIKFSCKFNDILRCSRTRHFISCFRKGGRYDTQPALRCLDSTWAIVYTPDNRGDFLGRAFVHYDKESGTYSVDKIYGNKLTYQHIEKMFIMRLEKQCRYSGSDTYLRHEAQ